MTEPKPNIIDQITDNDSVHGYNAYRQLANKLIMDINAKSNVNLSIKERFESYDENNNPTQQQYMEGLMKAGYLKVGQKTVKHFIDIFSRQERICGSMKIIPLNQDGDTIELRSAMIRINGAWQDLIVHLCTEGIFTTIRKIESLKQQQPQPYGFFTGG